MESNPVDALYRSKTSGVDFQTSDTSLKDIVERLATFPLIAQPGKAWNYSVATDVLGYLVEVISGQPWVACCATVFDKRMRPLLASS